MGDSMSGLWSILFVALLTISLYLIIKDPLSVGWLLLLLCWQCLVEKAKTDQ